MLRALSEDAACCAGMRATGIDAPQPLTLALEKAALQQLAQEADGCIIIAPEFDGILEQRCRWVEEAGGTLLGPSAKAVHLVSDKWRLAQHWHERNVPTPATWLEAPAHLPARAYLHKHRFGAGSLHIGFGQPNVATAMAAAPTPWVYQAFHPGTSASVSLLIGPDGWCLPLLPAEQCISADGQFRYEGGRLPLPSAWHGRAIRLAQAAVAGIAGLKGYVGVDMVLGEAADGSADAAIEINPRLTTSYLGLRQLLMGSLLSYWLRVLQGERPDGLSWRQGSMHFQPHGAYSMINPPF